jgi:hypothetical protein
VKRRLRRLWWAIRECWTGNPIVGELGACPICVDRGNAVGFAALLNVGCLYWNVCREHRLRWQLGSNFISEWRYETEDDWRRNWALLKNYREVDPVCWSSRFTEWLNMRAPLSRRRINHWCRGLRRRLSGRRLPSFEDVL